MTTEQPDNLKGDQTMVGFEGGPQDPASAEEPVSLEDMRAQTERVLGGRPGPGTRVGPPDALVREDVSGILPPVSREQEVVEAARNTSLLEPKDDDPRDPLADPEDDAARISEVAAAQVAQGNDNGQASYLPPDVPSGHLGAPSADAFANATWLPGRAQDEALVESVMEMEEFAHLQEFTYETIWHRNGSPSHPFRDLDGGRMPMLARVEISNPLLRWWARDHEVAMPDFFVGLYYRHFEALREEQGMFYHGEQIKMAVHMALSTLAADEGILKNRPPDVVVQSVKTVERWGITSQGLRRLHRPMLALPSPDEE